MANLKKQTFPVLNMHCAGCANNVEKTVRKLVGITDASVNFASNTLSVSYEMDKLTPGEIRAAVLAAGYDLIIEEDHVEERQEEEQQKRYRRLKGRVINRSCFEALEVKAAEMAKKYDCPFVDNEMPYGRVPQGHPVIVDYFYHEEIRGTENTGKRNR